MAAADRRPALLQPVIDRMEAELRLDAGNPAANYWLAVSARDSGDTERAWHAAVAAWVRAPLRPETVETLREDLDRFVTTVLIPDRSRTRPVKDQQAVLTDLRAQWDLVKDAWK